MSLVSETEILDAVHFLSLVSETEFQRRARISPLVALDLQNRHNYGWFYPQKNISVVKIGARSLHCTPWASFRLTLKMTEIDFEGRGARRSGKPTHFLSLVLETEKCPRFLSLKPEGAITDFPAAHVFGAPPPHAITMPTSPKFCIYF